MAVTMGLTSRVYTYGAKAYGYASRALGLNNSFSRQLASANKNVLEGSSIDLLRAFKRELSPRYWGLFQSECVTSPNCVIAKNASKGFLERENLAACALGQDLGVRGAKSWTDMISGLIDIGKLNKNSTYRDFAKAIIKD